MAQRRADERMAGITAAHRFRLGEQRPGWLAKSQAFSSVMKQERNLELIKQRSDARRAASEKETAAAPESAAEAPPCDAFFFFLGTRTTRSPRPTC